MCCEHEMWIIIKTINRWNEEKNVNISKNEIKLKKYLLNKLLSLIIMFIDLESGDVRKKTSFKRVFIFIII